MKRSGYHTVPDPSSKEGPTSLIMERQPASAWCEVGGIPVLAPARDAAMIDLGHAHPLPFDALAAFAMHRSDLPLGEQRLAVHRQVADVEGHRSHDRHRLPHQLREYFAAAQWQLVHRRLKG